jgi:hypothetical protein
MAGTNHYVATLKAMTVLGMNTTAAGDHLITVGVVYEGAGADGADGLVWTVLTDVVPATPPPPPRTMISV